MELLPSPTADLKLPAVKDSGSYNAETL